MRRNWIRTFALLLASTLSTSACAEDTGNFYALFFDGSHVAAPALPRDIWCSDEATLGGRRLFGTQNPVRMIQDMSPGASPKGPRVIMANGDVLPGKLVGFLPPRGDDNTPARLLIALDGSLITADPRGLAVRADRVMRVVSAGDESHACGPGSLRLANNVTLSASAIRWSEQGLKALTERGLTTVPYDTISDLCVPKPDSMQAVLDDSFYPPLGPTATIGRLETVQGAVLTYYRDMTLIGASKASPLAKYLLVQPGWSSGVILVPIDGIWRQSMRAAQEVPLSLLPASLLREKAGIHRWPWRRNENVEGDTLAGGSIMVDLGIGTHPYCEIAFQLPAQAKRFTALVGLDRRIGPGACAKGTIYADQVAGKPLFSSGLLRSGQEPSLAGPLPVGGCRRLVLVTEWAGEDRPPGAYPLDIGGHVDWLMPFVTIDADDSSFCQSLRSFLPGWAAWELNPADARRVRVVPYWDAAGECWLPILYVAGDRPVTLKRTLAQVSSANDLIELAFANPDSASIPEIELRVDGTLVAPTTLRREGNNRIKHGPLLRQPADGRAVAPQARPRLRTGGGHAEIAAQFRVRTMQWDLQRYDGRPVELELDLPLKKQVEGLVWRELTTVPAIGDTTPKGKP